MHYGVHVPHFGAYADALTLASLAADAESAGWDGFFIWDHLVMAWSDRVVDPWVALTAIALRTEKLRFGPLVTPLARRRPAKVARETASLDRLSSGRLILGVGLGTHPEEFENLGEPTGLKTRAAMLDEALDVVTGLWNDTPFSYQGEHYHVQDTYFTPPPYQQPRIPIWVAGKWPNKPPFRRAARWDGAIPQGQNLGQRQQQSPQEIRDVVAYIQAHRTSDTPFDVVHSGISDDADDREQVAQYADAGVTWWLENVNPWRFGWDTGSDEWPTEAMRERILQGPPRI